MEQFKDFVKKYGKGVSHQKIYTDSLNPYKEYLIPEVENLLVNNGISSYMEGFFWTLNPADYVEWLNEFIILETICLPFGRTAFGDIIFLCDHKPMLININKGLISRTVDKIEWFFNLCLTEKYFLDKYFSKQIFDQLTDKNINQDECFGYTPLLSLGGKEAPENLNKVGMKGYIDIVGKSIDELSFFT